MISVSFVQKMRRLCGGDVIFSSEWYKNSKQLDRKSRYYVIMTQKREKSIVRKMKTAMAMGVSVIVLSACGQTEKPEETQTNVTDGAVEISDKVDEIQETQNVELADSANSNPAEGKEEGHPVTGKEDIFEENLTGEYEYLSDYGTGRLTIKQTPHGFDISDYESEASYRFLADASNVEIIEDNRIYIKYPEQISSDGEAVYGYYVLEYNADEIEVYYGKSSFEEVDFLYHATKKMDAGEDGYEYEGEYNSYDIDEPALEIKKNDDGTYQIQIDLFRLYLLDDGIGKETENGLEFTVTGPGSDENKMNGVITLEENIAIVTIFGQEWLDFAGLNEYRFYKTSDVPNIYDDSGDINADSETTAEELLDLFTNGSIYAVDSTDSTRTFYITDLNMNSEEWDSYSIGEKVDLDNDGENELGINGIYGGIYLDARDNKVYEFASGGGTALKLSYTCYNGAIWIMYSNRMNVGYEAYHMKKFEGADNLVAEMNFGEELVDPNNAESGMKYTWNGAIISYDEYTELCSKIFAAEVSTN